MLGISFRDRQDKEILAFYIGQHKPLHTCSQDKQWLVLKWEDLTGPFANL